LWWEAAPSKTRRRLRVEAGGDVDDFIYESEALKNETCFCWKKNVFMDEVSESISDIFGIV